MNSTKTISGFLAKKSLLSTAFLAAVFCFTAVPRLQAESQAKCQRRVERAEHDLHRAIDRHGRHSRQADHERRELHAARERCWRESHQWWDEHERRWRHEHDWDEHDHDRD